MSANNYFRNSVKNSLKFNDTVIMSWSNNNVFLLNTNKDSIEETSFSARKLNSASYILLIILIACESFLQPIRTSPLYFGDTFVLIHLI